VEMEATKIISEARSIGERIRQARKSRSLSQAGLALRVGVSQPAIANWESGIHDPRRLTLAKLADALDSPLDWLAAGDRSVTESDKNAAAAYIRRPLRHVPVISLRAAALLAQDINADPHTMAEDYIPVTLGPSKLFAVFVSDEAVNLAFLPDTLVVIDFHDRMPGDGEFCLAHVNQTPMLRRWRAQPARLEAVSSEAGYETIAMRPDITIIGCVRVSIRVH
jgi:transcriptional regulator with XRE-family HTH domain